MKIAIADINIEQLEAVGREVESIVGSNNLLVIPTDVSKLEQVQNLKDKVLDKWGEVSYVLLINGLFAVVFFCLIGCSSVYALHRWLC